MLRELGLPDYSPEIKYNLKTAGEVFALRMGVKTGFHLVTLGTMGELSLLAYAAGVSQTTASSIILGAYIGLSAGGLFLTNRLLTKV